MATDAPFEQEVKHAVQWWTTALLQATDTEKGRSRMSSRLTPFDESVIEKFKTHLHQELSEKFQGHWYPENPQRGSGYRSISFDHRMDPILTKVAKSCGFERQVENRFRAVRSFVMYINPGEVRLKNNRLASSPAEVIWSSRKGPQKGHEASPPARAKDGFTKPHYSSAIKGEGLTGGKTQAPTAPSHLVTPPGLHVAGRNGGFEKRPKPLLRSPPQYVHAARHPYRFQPQGVERSSLHVGNLVQPSPGRWQ
jgi:protein Tob/BTG